MSLQDLIRKFDYTRISKSPAVFDMGKLRWMNGEYIKAMDEEKYLEKALPFVKNVVGDKLDAVKIADLMKTRIEVFPDIEPAIDFFAELPDYDVELFTHKKMKTDAAVSKEVLTEMLPGLQAIEKYDHDNLSAFVTDYVTKKGIKNGQALWPLRIAVSGKAMTPGGAYEIMEILGKDESLRRIGIALEKLG